VCVCVCVNVCVCECVCVCMFMCVLGVCVCTHRIEKMIWKCAPLEAFLSEQKTCVVDWRSMLHLLCVAVYCSVLQCVAVCCSVPHLKCFYILQIIYRFSYMNGERVLQCFAVCCSCSVLQCVAVCCIVLPPEMLLGFALRIIRAHMH